ncbi:YozE family protein [Lactiplantibacillus plantarum]|uniref:YozE family protein n=1 Tax=Lactiplantibacillus plantarum TaxID=1590 RepID=UPI001C5749EE|nr:YozE family protein [Lactiplantibacillus plantarum]MBW1621022.1 YozE family protein [Lactiplantibacillus plantarum]
MHKTFYTFLMTQRNPDSTDTIAEFANNAFLDQSFPKQSKDFHELSQYLELNAGYLPTMTVFDDAWQAYLASEA